MPSEVAKQLLYLLEFIPSREYVVLTIPVSYTHLLEDNAILPIRGTKGAAGIDLTCTKIETALNEANQLMLVYHTGISTANPVW